MSADLVAHLKAENEKLRKELESSNFMNHQMVGASEVYQMLEKQAKDKCKEVEIDLARYLAIADERLRQIDEQNRAMEILIEKNAIMASRVATLLAKLGLTEASLSED